MTKCVLVDRPVDVEDVGVPLTTVTTTLEAVTTATDAELSGAEVLDGSMKVELLLVVSGARDVDAEKDVADASASSDPSSAADTLASVAFGLLESSPPLVTAVGGAKSTVVEAVEVNGAR